jgi:tetratricopeptide (TPR) repeat protein
MLQQDITLLSALPESSPLKIELDHAALSAVFEHEGRHGDALLEAEQAIAFMQTNAPRDPGLVALLNNAACALFNLGRTDESERMFERALQVASDIYGENNRVPAAIMLNYAELLRQGKQKTASAVWQKRGVDALQHSYAHDTATIEAEALREQNK